MEYEPIIYSSLKNVCDQLKSKPEIQFLIFIDGDNSLKSLDSLAWVMPEHIWNNKNCDWPNVHAIITFSKQGNHSSIRLQEFTNRPWLSIIRSRTRLKDSAEFCIVMQSAMLHYILPENVTFVFVSADRFVFEPIGELCEWNRKCKSIKMGVLVGHFLAYSLESIFHGKLISDVAEKVVRQNLANGIRFKNLEETLVNAKESPEDLLGCVFNQHWTEKAKISQETVSDEKAEDDRLRKLYFENWKGSHASFCQMYKIDKSNFNKWRKGTKTGKQLTENIRNWAKSQNLI